MNKNKLFEEYFETYKNQVIRFLVSRGGDEEISQEICQQVFYTFYVSMNKVEAGYVKAWLFKSARNALIDYFRKVSARNEVSLDAARMEQEGILSGSDPDIVENLVINGELSGRILREVRKVNESFYEVLSMICVDGMSYEEAAAKLNVSEQAVRTRLHRAREYVREHYGDEYWGR